MRQIFVNSKIYTADKAVEGTAFVVEEGAFLYVGSDEEAKKYAREGDEVRDMKGSRIIPGMVDTHCHFLLMSAIGFDEWFAVNYRLQHDEVLAFVKEIGETYSVEECPVICGLGYGPGCRPLASELDKAVSDRPVLLMDSGGHTLWMNTKMLEMAEIDANTPDPKPGASYFARDAEGNPTGQALEADAVMGTIRESGLGNKENILKNLPAMIDLLHSFGVVAVFDASVVVVHERDYLKAMAPVDWKMHFFTSFYFSGLRPNEELLTEMIGLRAAYSSKWLHPTTLKVFKDGTLEPGTAYLYEDYGPPLSGRGAQTHANEAILAIAKPVAEEGFNLHIHAIGDRAISEVLDVYEEIGEIEGTKTMAHVQLLPEDGIERFAQQNDIFFQATPVWIEREEDLPQILGGERLARQVPFRSMIDNGVRVVFGSDAPVSEGIKGINPFKNTYFAVGRGLDPDLAYPPQSEGITVADCIDAYTINGAYQVQAEEYLGSITPGKQAHFVVLDRDPFAIEWRELQEVKVSETWMEGECVYEAEK